MITGPDASIPLLSEYSELPLSELIFQAPPHQRKATPSKASSSIGTHAEASIPPLSQLQFPAPPLKRTPTAGLEASIPLLSQLQFPAPPLRLITITDPQNIPPISSLSQPTFPLPVFSQGGTESADLTNIPIPQPPLSKLQFPPPPKKHKAKTGSIPHVPHNIVDQPVPPSIIDLTSPPPSTQASIHPEGTSPQKTIPPGITMGLGQPSVPCRPPSIGTVAMVQAYHQLTLPALIMRTWTGRRQVRITVLPQDHNAHCPHLPGSGPECSSNSAPPYLFQPLGQDFPPEIHAWRDPAARAEAEIRIKDSLDIFSKHLSL